MRTHREHFERLGQLAEASRNSRRVADDDRAARDDEIEDADQDGLGCREIARATQLAPGQISKICADRTAARQAVG